MENVRYYIPTRGRVDRQLTLANLPEELHPLCTLVCPSTECLELQERWPNVRVQAQPPAIQTIGQKRKWIFKTLSADDGVEFAWQFDDDLIFKTCTPGGQFQKSSKWAAETRKWFFETEPKLRELYPVLGLGTSYFAPKGGIRENYHLGFAFGMNEDAMETLKMDRMDVFEDIDYTLQMLRAGIRIAVCYDVVVDQKQPDAPGGVTGERSAETIARDVKRLIDYHPGIVSLKPAGNHPAAVTRVNWKKAAREGGL